MASKLWASLAVAAGGALGAVLRYHVGRWVQPAVAFPVGTLVVNVSGCLAFGLLTGLMRGRSAEGLQLFVFTGVLGGYTTFSTFGHETVSLLRVAPMRAGLYVVASVVAGLVGVAVGLWVGERVVRGSQG